ncbi:MAG: AbrB/MazE/SpoVT family DNA-binding domain-containing protein [Candidatus Dormibacteraceae bacterium]
MSPITRTVRKMHVRLGDAGRVVLPAVARKALGVAIGDELLLTIESDSHGAPAAVRLQTVLAAIERAQNIVAEHIIPTAKLASEELIEERRLAAKQE